MLTRLHRNTLVGLLCSLVFESGCPAPSSPSPDTATSGPLETSTSTDSDGSGDNPNEAGSSSSTSTETSATEPFDTTGTDGETEHFCGDGILDPGEECDHGDENHDNAQCTSSCKLASCGDGFKQPGEECDLGDENLNTGDCTEACTNPSCGDGFTQPGEQCDNGPDNGTELGQCHPSTCSIVVSVCGDKMVEGDEECDAGPDPDPASGCTTSCVFERRVVFVTNATFSANFMTTDEADAACQQTAGDAGISPDSTFIAWLSTTNASMASRLPEYNGYYVRTDDEHVAHGSADLLDGSLSAPISRTEKGDDATLLDNTVVWTGTTESGATSESHCNNWTSKSSLAFGTVGSLASKGKSWTSAPNVANCSFIFHLYCIEVE